MSVWTRLPEPIGSGRFFVPGGSHLFHICGMCEMYKMWNEIRQDFRKLDITRQLCDILSKIYCIAPGGVLYYTQREAYKPKKCTTYTKEGWFSMKKRLLGLSLAVAMSVGLLTGCGGAGKASWKVTCPWAPSGVAAVVSQKTAEMSSKHSDSIALVAEAIKGDAATVNSWVAGTKANDKELVFAGEGLFSITSILDPDKMQFTYEDFVFVENLYSSIFVLSADADLNIKSIPELEQYVKSADEISVAVNGATSSEAFLAAALFGSMNAGDKLKLTPYQSAAEAAQAVAKGETSFAVSHQSQILETYQQKGVTVVCAFDKDNISNGPFAGVEGVGKYGYPYFRNRCLVLARAGTDAEKVTELKNLYGKIMADEEVVTWLHETMLLEVDLMSEDDVKAHIENVKSIVNEYKDIVAG